MESMKGGYKIKELICPSCEKMRSVTDDYYRKSLLKNKNPLCPSCSAKISSKGIKQRKIGEINTQRLKALKQSLEKRNLELIETFKFEEFPPRKDNSYYFTVKCLTCGYEWKDTSMHLLVNKKKCPECIKNNLREKRSLLLSSKKGKYSKEQIQNILHSKSFKLLTENPSGKAKDTIEVECEHCGRRKSLSLHNFLYYDYRCANCKNSFSKGENLVKNILEKLEVEYSQNYKFGDCKDKNTLPFDFYLPRYNCCIEYQGCQHYSEKEYKNLTRGSNRGGGFESLQKRDQIKRDYCKGNNILYIELFDYQSEQEIKNILKEKIYGK